MTSHTATAPRRASRLATIAACVALLGGLAGCGPDGPDGPGAAAVHFDDDVSGNVLQPGDQVVLTATEFQFSPDEVVAEPGAYAGEFVNDGAIAHNLTFSSGESFDLGPGESVAIDFVVPEEGLTFVCAIEGHKDAGMSGEVHTRSTADSGA